MYCNKENVNILTSLLVGHGVTEAVLCPGSRNAPIVHNLVTCPDIICHPVTDERSAGFYALGMAQALCRPVAVCVTSGSALLNLLPAVAEAYYQHIPLVVISADRPAQWIDQLDGQTLPQPDALGRFVRKAVTLPEVMEEGGKDWQEEGWFCNRLINEALMAARQGGGGPVHINVPISEPLYIFNVPTLLEERVVSFLPAHADSPALQLLASEFLSAERPMIVVGQTSQNLLTSEDFAGMGAEMVVLNEALSIGRGACHFDELLSLPSFQEGVRDGSFIPDFVLYLGDMLVSKRLRTFLRSLKGVTMWQVSVDGALHDTTMSFSTVIEGHPADVLQAFREQAKLRRPRASKAFYDSWEKALAAIDEKIENEVPSFSPKAAVRLLEKEVSSLSRPYVHYANSTAVRLANIYAKHYVYCNRGVNGIEGSLSTAAGFSLAMDEPVYCVIGDLSFFYDSNALWNQELRGNLRILLLNNGGGGIFEKFEGLKGSPARERFVMAQHSASAEGLCQSYDIRYRTASNMQELEAGIDWLLHEEDSRPLLLEVKEK